MPETIKTGTVLIKHGALLPDALQFESEPCATGWRLVKDLDGYELDRKIHDAGWTFFYLAGEIKTTIFGFDVQKTVRRAVKRILANLRPQKFNSLQITQVVSKHFFGVPCTQVYAHPRHVQKSMFLFRDEDVQKWGQTKISGDANPSVVRAKDQILSLEKVIAQPDVATS
ncbi:MAG: hypothetical protein WA690_09750 [Candidatus Acidiferrales bacterium]